LCCLPFEAQVSLLNIEEYEKTQFAIYEAFARTVRFILEEALQARPEVPRPQSVQHRAKSVQSVRRRLEQAGKLGTEALEIDRRDLAGARLIFYTNNDVERFLATQIVRENFEIEEDSTKIHHPTPENEGARYRAVHYTVRLRDERARLSEYARFAGLRCEIQVQTILNHAWSETSHDILYKDAFGVGYGEKAMGGIRQRFEQIMDKYLIPAGFEIQKAQQEYERLLQGKELYDKNIVRLLDNAQNNNERYEILTGLRDYAIPNYDDIQSAYRALRSPLFNAVTAARQAEPISIKTAFGDMEGYKADTITGIVVEIAERLRYVDVLGTFQFLIDVYREEPSDEIRKQILGAVKKLADYNIEAHERVGPRIQMDLIEHLAAMSASKVDSIRSLAITVWREALQAEITGEKWKADSVVLSRGAVPASDLLRKVRSRAIDALIEVYDRSSGDVEKTEILSALSAATRGPNQASNELLAMVLEDAVRVVDFMTSRVESESYELLQHQEHNLLYDYFRAKEIAEGPNDGCKAPANALVTAIQKFRDAANADERFVRYKVLVGFESVFPAQWTDEDFDFEAVDAYRSAQGDGYIEAITGDNELYWLDLLKRCAETVSNDGATFPPLGSFIRRLSERKPDVADRFLIQAPDNLRKFLAGFLNGLARSARPDIYERRLERELEAARDLAGLVQHLRNADSSKPDLLTHALDKAINQNDVPAVVGCLLLAFEHFETDKVGNPEQFACRALKFLNGRMDASWIAQAWFLKKITRFFEVATDELISQILQSLGFLRTINYQAERILSPIARRKPELVWDFFGNRLVHRDATSQTSASSGNRDRFEDLPFELHELKKALSQHPQIALEKSLEWFRRDRKLFRFRGGHFIYAVFPEAPPEFVATLTKLVREGTAEDADFVLEILQNYHGEIATHAVLKEIVSRYPADVTKVNKIRISIDHTGVVSGELGFANAWRTKKDALAEWLTDERLEVREFAKKHIAELDRMIVAEHRNAESEKEMRNRDFEDDGDS